jgi:hypothetical protein
MHVWFTCEEPDWLQIETCMAQGSVSNLSLSLPSCSLTFDLVSSLCSHTQAIIKQMCRALFSTTASVDGRFKRVDLHIEDINLQETPLQSCSPFEVSRTSVSHHRIATVFAHLAGRLLPHERQALDRGHRSPHPTTKSCKSPSPHISRRRLDTEIVLRVRTCREYLNA